MKQPWAWAIIHARKDVENRDWSTDYRGPLLIHAGKENHAYDKMPPRVRQPKLDDLTYSAIIGIVDLVGVVKEHSSKWRGETQYAWVLANPRPLKKPIHAKGKLGLWKPEPQLTQKVRRQLSEPQDRD